MSPHIPAPPRRPDEADRADAAPLAEAVAAVKPRLRGWLHAAITPLAGAAGIVLITLATTAAGRIGGAVFLAASLLLFGTSALYHRGTWGARTDGVLRRLDHANIYIFIAATYTPLALQLLTGRSQTVLLVLVWAAALGGLLFRLLWLGAPRWLYTVLYIAMGWAAVGWLRAFYQAGGVAAFTLIGVGGLLYTAGGIAYAIKKPNPWPGTFGYHEVFHAMTIVAAICHYIAVYFAMYNSPFL
ncbi:MAG: PAQR family membrane homeostasis protein TrhA [Actinomycetes bacterium]